MKSEQITIPEIQAIEAFKKHFQAKSHIVKLSKFLHELNRDMSVRELLKVVAGE